jgi:DNA-binding transcriptional ArsR family regulator
VNDRPKGLADLDRLETVFAALAHPTRRQILTVLRARGGTMTSGELAERFDCTWPTTTRHLGILTNAGLVTVTRHGRQRHYHLDTTPLTDTAATWINRFHTNPHTND